MRITKLIIKNYGRIENCRFNLDKVTVIETPFIKEICCAISEILYSDYLRLNLPHIKTSDKTVIDCEILACKQKFTIRVSFNNNEPIRELLSGDTETDNSLDDFQLNDNSFEQEMTSLFLNKYEFEKRKNLLSFVDYKNYFAFYKGSKDKNLPSTEFSYLYGEKFFRYLLNNYIKSFKPIWINKNKNIYLKLLGNGEFESYKLIEGKEEKCCLSETEKAIFDFIAFVEIGRFWGELNRVQDLNRESKPLIAVNLLEHIDAGFDAENYIKNLKQNRQIIILKEK